jgi:hypothetical protein
MKTERLDVKNLGNVRAGVTKTITFSYDTEGLEIIELKSSCGCAVPVYNKHKKELTVKYTPKFPKHLKLKTDVHSAEKEVFIVLETGDKIIFPFKATVVK